MEVRATARNVDVSPKKVQLILQQLPGKGVGEALTILRFNPQPASQRVLKLLRSAVANAENNYQLSPRNLQVVAAWASDGLKFKRWQPKARGRVGPIIKRRSHITVVVDERS
jgi:large subunit ribosomal protein L22